MSENTTIRTLLQRGDFATLFVEELGWDRHNATLDIVVDAKPSDGTSHPVSLQLTALAQKRGMVVLLCPPLNGLLPDSTQRRSIEKQVARNIHEHLIIFTEDGQTEQVWQWVKREAGRPDACREHRYNRRQPGESLMQKLRAMTFSLNEEESLTLVEVTGRIRAAFDVEKVTKRFYDRFKKEHDAFLAFVTGIPDSDMQQWYVSVMLNRLMFIYFIQKKGFLDNDQDYLQTKLAQYGGQDTYYRDFLGPLFFEGFAKQAPERSADAAQKLGDVPYLNGGLFLRHQIEEQYGDAIQIADAAFTALFAFFDQYHWHLDERPLRQDNEINPDVLGYIFEKYINQKQMGAYYTKEDITGYISQNTIIPFLFDAAQPHCRIAFEGEQSVWRLLRDAPDRYVYDAVQHGVTRPLPPEIAAGIDDIAQRTGWNKPADPDYALPTETWREVVARRRRYETVRDTLASGAITSINDLVTYNLNIRQFAQDVVDQSEGPELLRAFWKALQQVTVLDPTAGSGAFLFAALSILEPLYEACLERMQGMVQDNDALVGASGDKPRGNPAHKYRDFREVLERTAQHPNRRYFILKSIIVNNLFGVDIMEEAVEICKLRLFLKLVAQVEQVADIEPLPDIDFNIRAGNTLVGFACYEAVKQAITNPQGNAPKLLLTAEEEAALAAIEERARDVDRLFTLFRQQQTELGGAVTLEDKQELRRRLDALNDELNRYLAQEYGVEMKKRKAYEQWRTTHQPFHWFVEFYGIMQRGGFDVIIGNPPYVEYSKVRSEYRIRNYDTESCGNLYAFAVERAFSLLHNNANFGMIVPLSIVSTKRMLKLQDFVKSDNRSVWFSLYDVYPSKVFEGAKQRLAIVLTTTRQKHGEIFASRYNRWRPDERDHLIQTLFYWRSWHEKTLATFPKTGNSLTENILKKVMKNKTVSYTTKPTKVSFYVHRIPYNYIKAFDFIPYFWNEIDGQKKSEDYKPYSIKQTKDANVVLAVLNSNLFFWWWYVLFEGYHCGKHEIQAFPVGLDKMRRDTRTQLQALAKKLMNDIKNKRGRKTAQYKNTGQVEYDEFYPRLSKPIIDEIDRVLAQHYGFTEEELDFIINYDIKYRMGRETGEEE